jgi:Ca-activated chloride channel family protein
VKRALAILCLALIATAQPPEESPVFKVDVELVRILATVKDAAGQSVGALSKEDFQIFDNGVRQELAVFDRYTEQPLSVALLVDTSASTGKELRYELDSALRFVKSFFASGNPEDAVSLYSFNYTVTLQSSFTRRASRIEQELKNLRPTGGTSLYDAIYFASRRMEDRPGRHALVVVTDGGDTTSAKTFHQALEAAQLADAVIYSILVMPITNDAGRNIGGENALATMAARTGGRVFAPSVGPALDEAFSEILRDLRTQYLLAFYPRNTPPTKERFHRLEIKLKRPGLQVQARNGYYGNSGTSTGAREPQRGPRRSDRP